MYLAIQKIEVADHFCYLEATFAYTGNMNNAVKTLSGETLKE